MQSRNRMKRAGCVILLSTLLLLATLIPGAVQTLAREAPAGSEEVFQEIALKVVTDRTLTGNCKTGQFGDGYLTLKDTTTQMGFVMPNHVDIIQEIEDFADCHIGTYRSPNLQGPLYLNGQARLKVTIEGGNGGLYLEELNFLIQSIPENDTRQGEEVVTGAIEGLNIAAGAVEVIEITSGDFEYTFNPGMQLNLMLFARPWGNGKLLTASSNEPGHESDSLLFLPARQLNLDISGEQTQTGISFVGKIESAFGPADIVESWVEVKALDGKLLATLNSSDDGDAATRTWHWNPGPDIDGTYLAVLCVRDNSGNVWTNETTFAVDASYGAAHPLSLLGIGGGVVAVAVVAGLGARKAIYYMRRRRDLTFVEDIFVIHEDGRLMAYATQRAAPMEENEVVSSLLATLRDFAKHYIKGSEGADLTDVSYGDMTILIEPGSGFFMAMVVSGPVPDNMHGYMTHTIKKLDAQYSDSFVSWDGDYAKTKGVKQVITRMLIFKQDAPLP